AVEATLCLSPDGHAGARPAATELDSPYSRGMSVRARLARETLLLTGAQLAGLAVGFLATVSITRALGPEARGVYAWILTLAGLGVQAAALAPSQTVRIVAAQDPG